MEKVTSIVVEIDPEGNPIELWQPK